MAKLMLFRTARGPVVEQDGQCRAVSRDWNELINDDALYDTLSRHCDALAPDASLAESVRQPEKPIVDQEVWAAGVTYYRSRTARMEESEGAGGGGCYDRVYDAERPELFLKATPHRVVGPHEAMHLRRDSRWIVPEPELVLVVTRAGTIVAYTIGNDLSCRDLEGENPLYLPQAKTFDGCAALGPGLMVSPERPDAGVTIRLTVRRGGHAVFAGETTLGEMKRTVDELVRYLFLENSHPQGCLLMTGTGIVPPGDFSLEPGDSVEIAIDGIGVLVNTMEQGTARGSDRDLR